MSGLLNQIQDHQLRGRNKCPIAKILETLDKDDKADLLAALATDSISARAIAMALIERGSDMNPNGERVRLHRRGQCGCARG